MLDWTDNPLIAAYFAARDAALLLYKASNAPNAGKVPAVPDNLHVWALQTGWVYGLRKDPRFPSFPVRIVTVPTATNVNLNAQGGVFSLVVDEGKAPEDPFIPKSLDDVLRDTFLRVAEQGMLHLTKDFPVLRCWSLSVKEAPKLLRLLSYEGITGATVMPGYVGVTRSLEEWRLWDGVG